MLLIYSNVSNFVQNLMNFFSWPKFDEGCWNYHMIPVHSSAVFISPSGAKKNGFGHYFAVDLVTILSQFANRHYLITCECSCVFCPNFQFFCSSNGQFFSVGDATASPASPCRTLMHATYTTCVSSEKEAALGLYLN